MPPVHRQDRGRIDPKRMHPFQETNDSGIGAVASGQGNYGGSQIAMSAVTSAFMRATRCAVPGCGKERHDEVHGSTDDTNEAMTED
jgi:hypothetical protein